MPILMHRRLISFAAIILFQGFLSLALTPVALALTPADLIVVYNANLPESRQVAEYYAGKRGVPPANLVGVKVSPGEDMTRQEYDQCLVPPLRQKVAELRLSHRNAAILLVYGLPLRVGDAALTETEQDIQALVRMETRKATAQGWAKLKELEGLLTRVKSPEILGSPVEGPKPRDVFKLAQDLVPRAERFLTWPRDQEIRPETRTRVAALAAELRGPRPDLEAGFGGKGQEDSLPQPVPIPKTGPAPDKERLQPGDSLATQARALGDKIRSAGGLLGELRFWEHLNWIYERPRTGAAVDSELALLMVENYPRVHWLPNPLHLSGDAALSRFRQAVVMVGRLDGPTPEIARRLVDDALKTEETGLTGTCYLDARGLPEDGPVGSYAWFDAHLVRLARLIKENSKFKVVLDQRPGLFLPGSCPEAALYCGWYSLAKYTASCIWRQGAVAYHVASAEATTLRKPGSQVWCKRMLEEGVAATLGPVSEPYLLAFPRPDEFFPLLMSGKLSLLEVYFRTVPHLSWQMVLIGDPLYNPFKRSPAWRPKPGHPAAPGLIKR